MTLKAMYFFSKLFLRYFSSLFVFITFTIMCLFVRLSISPTQVHRASYSCAFVLHPAWVAFSRYLFTNCFVTFFHVSPSRIPITLSDLLHKSCCFSFVRILYIFAFLRLILDIFFPFMGSHFNGI